MRGQRFELDLDAPDFTPVPLAQHPPSVSHTPRVIGEIRERDPSAPPVAPKLKNSKTGFPEHRKPSSPSAVQQQRARPTESDLSPQARGGIASSIRPATQLPPSDKAILHHVGKKYGYDFKAQEKRDISDENKRRIADMSKEDIEEARAELMANLNPAFMEKLLKRASLDDDAHEQMKQPQATQEQQQGKSRIPSTPNQQTLRSELDDPPSPPNPSADVDNASPTIHFPLPPRSASSFVPLDPNSPTFLSDLKSHYFPETPHDPSSLEWLQDPSVEEDNESSYNPSKDSFSTADLRFSFTGALIPPKESLQIDVTQGLHHHGLAPSSAGYTIPELAILSRSTLPSQRCIAWQVLGRILYRLGKGGFGPRGSELQEGLWDVIERERVIEVMMAEGNRDRGHVSAKSYAIEALWLWRKGGGGDRGVLKDGQKIAK